MRAAALAKYCPDLEQWPARWQIDKHDIAPGQRIVEFLTPFLLHLLGEALATQTLHRHRDPTSGCSAASSYGAATTTASSRRCRSAKPSPH
jgi:hypothetical protein